MANTVLIQSAPKPNAAFPLPTDASDKIWLKLAGCSWRYFCSKVWTTDDRAFQYYKLTLWALGSGELKHVGVLMKYELTVTLTTLLKTKKNM